MTYIPRMPKDEWEMLQAYYCARREHAFLLRCEGITYREIAARLGITNSRASYIVMKFGRIHGLNVRRMAHRRFRRRFRKVFIDGVLTKVEV